jgi:hypothetical protein
MLFDGITLNEGSHILNASIESGASFPLVPNVGELFYKTSVGLHVYDGSTWNLLNTSDATSFILKSGGTMTGYLVLNADPTTNLQAATKQYVDNSVASYAPLTGTGTSGTWGISITGNATTASAVPFSGITSKPTTLSGYGITDGQPLDGDLTSIAGLAGTSGLLKKTAANTWVLDTNTYLTSSTGVTSVTGTAGNITASASTGAVTLNLATITDSGLGSFKKITADGFGRVTGTTTVTSSDITTTLGYTPANKVGDSITGNFVFDGVHTVTGLPSPTGGTDAANKNYVDAATNGLTWKSAVRVASTTNINLTTGGLIAVDGVTTVAGDRVLVKDQTLPKENGIYIAGTGAWTRALDMNLASEFDGSAVFVKEGTLYQSSGWTETATVVTVGTDTVTFSEFTGGALYTWGVGLANTGNTVNIQLGAGIAELPTDEVGVDVYSGGGLMLTVDGTTPSTSTAAQVSLTKVGTSGTYTSVSTDSYGRVTSGSNPATVNSFNTRTGSVTLTSGDVTSALGSTTANYFLATPNGSTGTPSLRAIVAADIPTLNQNTTGNAGTATKLATARTISATGDGAWSVSFDGSTNVTAALTLTSSGVTAGTYNNSATAVTPITVNAKGLVTGTGANVTITPAFSSLTSIPTTVAGYGITDINSTYAPTLTGTGASGTWGISITGNAATVTTNANLTGVVTSVGNATSIGTGAITNTMLANSAVANLSGTNTGDQTISISGDVTASGSTGVLTATVTKINGTALSGLTTGLLKNTTTTGVPSIAIAGTDYLLPTGSAASLTNFPILNQNTTGNAATATTASTANALNTGNNYQMNSLGVGTAGSGTAGEIRATNNVTAYYSSDSRLKENIKPIENALAKVKLINGVTYDWTEDFIESHGGEDGYFIRKHDVGVIAQEVEAVMPEIVVDRDDGYKAVKYERMVALLIEAVKELSAEIEVLKAKVN